MNTVDNWSHIDTDSYGAECHENPDCPGVLIWKYTDGKCRIYLTATVSDLETAKSCVARILQCPPLPPQHHAHSDPDLKVTRHELQQLDIPPLGTFSTEDKIETLFGNAQ